MGWCFDERNLLRELLEREILLIRTKDYLNEFFFPGFIDTHAHASQYPLMGRFGGPFFMWIKKYFDLEKQFECPDFAKTVYSQVVSCTLRHGTTCAVYNTTIHVEGTNILADICYEKGQRALIGRVCMDDGPKDYHDPSVSVMLQRSKDSATYIRRLDPLGLLIKPIITPRYAVTSSAHGLSQLGELANSTSLHIQTHISEHREEVYEVASKFPGLSYAEVYDKACLLTRRTILAHGIHLTEAEKKLIQRRGASISHCPASNSSRKSGICPVRSLLRRNITVSLGTDICGGYSPSILEAAKQAIVVSRLMSYFSEDDEDQLNFEEALYLATRGEQRPLLIRLGKEVGYEGASDEDDYDPQNISIFPWDKFEDRIAKWVGNGDDRNTLKVWVGGRRVHSRGSRYHYA